MVDFESRVFTTEEIANLIGCTVSTVKRIQKNRNIVRVMRQEGSQRRAYYSYAAYRLIESVFAKNRLQKKQEQEEVKVCTVAKSEEHPLVTDKRLLNTYYFPDVIPDCFKEMED